MFIVAKRRQSQLLVNNCSDLLSGGVGVARQRAAKVIRVINRWNALDQSAVDAPSINAFNLVKVRNN